MNKTRSEILAVRVVNQYRKRDILPYLGLRYYFANRCAVRNQWATEVAIDLVLSSTKPAYFHVFHFKERDAAGKFVVYRDLHLPGPNEAFAEAALLAECSKYPEVFDNLPCVFAYRLAKNDYRKGVFETYFYGFQNRHRAIAKACKSSPSGVVLYTDVKKFYPSISVELAKSVWNKACDKSRIDSKFRELGDKMLDHHKIISPSVKDGAGLLTGPMFSHLIGNLVLQTLDEEMTKLMPGRYFRYVDDIVLVGTQEQVDEGRKRVECLLGSCKLELHSGDKDFRVPVNQWMKGAKDFEDDNSYQPNWKTFIGSLKQFLVVKPEQHDKLCNAFDSEELRIPIRAYSEEVMESHYLKRLFQRFNQQKARLIKARKITIDSLVQEGLSLRKYYVNNLRKQLEGSQNLTEYERKRQVSKLRFLAKYFIYLATSEELSEFSSLLQQLLQQFPEICNLAEIFQAVTTRDVSNLLSLGTDTVQAAAQVLRLSVQTVQCSGLEWTEVEKQGLAILLMSGIRPKTGSDEIILQNEINNFARWDGYGDELMTSDNPFIKELSCLHGVAQKCRHQTILDSAFDPDELLAFDVINLLQPDSY
jgi:hypothetical protein